MTSPTFPTIACRADDYTSASESFGGCSSITTEIHVDLLRTLAGYGGMAGSDSVGATWAASYDAAAGSALQASSHLVSTCVRVENLLAAGVYNHASGDADAHINGGNSPAPPTAAVDPCLAIMVPSAAGGDGADPSGWPVIKQVSGLLWPNGHQDRLRAAKEVWYAAAADLGQAMDTIPIAVGLLENQMSPEIPAAVAKSSEVLGNFQDLQKAFYDLGDACATYAQALDDAHHAILEQLRKMSEEMAAWEVGMAVLIPLTDGLSELGNGLTAERVTVYATRIGRIIADLAGKVAGLAGRVTEGVTTKLTALWKKLAEWLEKAATKFRGSDDPPPPGVTPKPPAVKPVVSDAKLKNIVDDMYKGVNNANRTGDGTTADAVRNELQTLEPTEGKWHLTKAVDYQRGLVKWLNDRNNTNPADRAVAIRELRNLMDALAGR